MKLCVKVLEVLAILAFTGSAFGDGQARVCPVFLDENEPEMHSKIAGMGWLCLKKKDTDYSPLENRASLDEYQVYFKSFCQNQPAIRECLADVMMMSEVCQNETSHQVFLVYRDLLETTLEAVCQQDGERAASLFMGLNFFAEYIYVGGQNSFRDCLVMGADRIAALSKNTIDPSSQIFVLYKELIETKECFNRGMNIDETFKRDLESFVNEILGKMNCIHPIDGTTVLCQSIDSHTMASALICPVKYRDVEGRSMEDLLEDELKRCLMEGAPDDERLEAQDSLQGFNTYFKKYCERQETIRRCLSEITLYSSVCLNDMRHRRFKTFAEFLKNGLENGCVRDGEPLQRVFYTIHSLEASRQTGNVVNQCINMAKAIRNESDERFDFSTNMPAFYGEFKVFKSCIIKKMHGENDSVFIVQRYFNEMLRNMKCIHPQSEGVVLCSTIHDSTETGVKECPFDTQSESAQYEFFVDMGFQCMRGYFLDFSVMNNLTTMSKYRSFFEQYCFSKSEVKNCLSNIALNSEACQNQTSDQIYKIFVDMMKSSLESVCTNYGKTLAVIMHGMKQRQELLATDPVRECKKVFLEKLGTISVGGGEASAMTLGVYRAAEALRECLANNIEEENDFKTTTVSFANGIIRNLKCIHPDDGTSVLCETIVNN